MGMHKAGRNDVTAPGASLDKATPVRYLREYIESVQAGLLPGQKIVTLRVDTYEPTKYVLINEEDGTKWRGQSDGSWKAL